MFFESPFWENFISSLAATVIGAGVGVFLALKIDRKLAKEQDKKEESKHLKLEKQENIKLLTAIKGTVEKNLDLLNEVEKQLSPTTVIFFNIDLTLFEALSSKTSQSIKNLELAKVIENLRYELTLLHRKIELQLDMNYGTVSAMNNYIAKRKELVNAILGHTPKIKSLAESVIKMIDKEIN